MLTCDPVIKVGGAIITEHLEALVSALAFLAQIGLFPVRAPYFILSFESIYGPRDISEETSSCKHSSILNTLLK